MTGRGIWHLRMTIMDRHSWLPQRRRARPSAGLDELLVLGLSAIEIRVKSLDSVRYHLAIAFVPCEIRSTALTGPLKRRVS